MSDNLGENGRIVDAQKYERDKRGRIKIELLLGGTACILRKLLPPEIRTAEKQAEDHPATVLEIIRGDKALGGWAVLLFTNDGLQHYHFDPDSICVETKQTERTELGYIVGHEEVPTPRASINTASASRFSRLDTAANSSVAATKESVLAT